MAKLFRRPYSLATILFLVLVACAIVSTVALVLSDLTAQQGLGEVGKAGLTLIVGVILGGVLKQALDTHAQNLDERSKQRDRLLAMLTNLENTYDSIQNARLLISAQRSARAYSIQIQQVILARVMLLNIKRSISDNLSTQVQGRNLIHDRLDQMICYLANLCNEYQAGYQKVSDTQRFDEEVTTRRISQAAKDTSPTGPELPVRSEYAWEMLTNETTFMHLAEFLGEEFDKDEGEFRKPYLATREALVTALTSKHSASAISA